MMLLFYFLNLKLFQSSLSPSHIYYKYKIFLPKKFSQEHVFATLWPILENISSRKLNRGKKIVKTRLNNV